MSSDTRCCKLSACIHLRMRPEVKNVFLVKRKLFSKRSVLDEEGANSRRLSHLLSRSRSERTYLMYISLPPLRHWVSIMALLLDHMLELCTCLLGQCRCRKAFLENYKSPWCGHTDYETSNVFILLCEVTHIKSRHWKHSTTTPRLSWLGVYSTC